MTQKKGKLYLLPNSLGRPFDPKEIFGEAVFRAFSELDGLIAENANAAQNHLMHFDCKKPAHQMPIASYNKKTNPDDIDFIMEPLEKGETWGYMSEAGLPCVADPGAELVRAAYRKNIKVEALIGPSSIFQALSLSGFAYQRFNFSGYLSRKGESLAEELKELETRSFEEGSTQIFIDAPQRSLATAKALLDTLEPDTYLCIASQLQMPDQFVRSSQVRYWKKDRLDHLERKPTIFVIAKEANNPLSAT